MTTKEITVLLEKVEEGQKLLIIVRAPQIGNKLFDNEGTVKRKRRDSQTDELIMLDFGEEISSLCLVKKSESEERIWALGGFPIESIQLIS